MSGRGPRALPAWLVGSTAIALAMGLMNLGTYGFTILAARLLGPVDYGAFAAMMGVLLVVSVASLGLQATAARRVAAAPEDAEAIEAQILVSSRRWALGLGAGSLAASPLLAGLLQLDSWVPAALLAVTVVPLTLMGGQAGVLQGGRRWLPLALVYLGTGAGRIVLGATGLLVRSDATGAMGGVAVGACVPVVVGWLALRRHPTTTTGPSAARRGSVRGAGSGLTSELVHNSHALLAFFALSNADVIVARLTLTEHDAGLYAGGLILTKAVLFLPQFVVVVAFPSMARSRPAGRAHRRGLALVAALGALTTGAVALLPDLAVVFVGGAQYAEVGPVLWLFSVLGTVLALLQLTVYDVVAQQDQRTVLVVWAALALLLAAAPAAWSMTSLALLVTAVDLVLLTVLLVLLGRRRRSPIHGPVPTAGGTLAR